MTTLAAEEAMRRFAAGRVARMATVRSDARPHLVPIVFATDGDTIYSAVDEKPKRTPELKRLDNIRANPNVTLMVDHYEDDWDAVWWVRADGIASVVEEGPERDRARELLTAKYREYREGVEVVGAAVVVRVSRWSGWSYA
jgi:PPOX class probable F420-dependent enzyme